MHVRVEEFIAERRRNEPSHNRSVAIWLELDRQRLSRAEREERVAQIQNDNDEVLNIRRARRRRSRDPFSPPTVSVLFDEDILKDIREEARRQDRTFSWLLQRAWEAAREKIKSFAGGAP